MATSWATSIVASEKVVPTNLNSLKNAVRNERSRRGQTINTTPTDLASGTFITATRINQILADLNALNSTGVAVGADSIIRAYDLNVLRNIVNMHENAPKVGGASTCGSGCIGLCTSCSGTCTGGCTSCNGCAGGCSGCNGRYF